MKLTQLSLKNIRTYTDEVITFPSSSLMLSGDIGSGKSSLLLAIEFALFGLVRGEFSGESILRKGTQEGTVSLTFLVKGQKYTIERSLKKGSRGIQQQAGAIIVEGVREDLTPVELRAKIFSLLGYPNTQAKSLIYRYTVYTPQEELKRIIQEDAETRLDVLRKVFAIDKYKRIRENAEAYLRSLRDEIMKGEAQLEQLPEQKKERSRLSMEKEIIQKERNELLPKKELLTKQKEEKETLLSVEEKNMQVIQEQKKQKALLEEQRKNLEQSLFTQKERKEVLLKKQASLQEVIKNEGGDEETLKKQVEQFSLRITQLEDEQKRIVQQRAGIETRIKEAETVKKKFEELSSCPVCRQDVPHTHKEHIFTHEEEKIKKLQQEREAFNEKKIAEELAEQKRKKEILQEHLRKAELIAYQRKTFKEGEEELRNIEKLIEEGEVKKEAVIKSFAEIIIDETQEKNYQETKKAVDIAREALQSVLQKEAVFNTKITSYDEQQKKIEEYIVLLEKKKEEIQKKTQLRNWVKDHFANLMDVMEKHVMLRIQQEFNRYFQEWFSFLLEDENMMVSIDEAFTPFIQQQGYEIAFNDLSGGERSSVALAYRLALTKVINDLVGSIHTKDLLVLDEPTDGFSSAQIDRLKDVLEQLDMEQIILVSHEPKVESFVQDVIHIEKEHGISKVL